MLKRFIRKILSKYLFFRDVRKAIRGRLSTSCESKSLIFFTAHKCASTYLGKVITDNLEKKGYTHLDPDSYFAITNIEKRDEIYSDLEFQERFYQKRGRFYGPFRFYRNIPDINQYDCLLVLRDPRDVLVSHYFSIKHSHPLLNQRLVDEREKLQTETIDEYVKRIAPRFKETYTQYLEHLVGLPNVCFIKYEELLLSSDEGLNKLSALLNLNTSELRSILKMKKEHSNEDIHAHHRIADSGEYLKKLSSDTIQHLNSEFCDILKKLNYTID